jgi:purine-binding chemotaxis protein CheW
MKEWRRLVVLRLGAQRYALPIEPIVQLVEMVTITPLPQAHPVVGGLITVRGASVPVVDLRRVLGLTATQRALHTPIVLLQLAGRLVGLLVDDVLDVRAAPAGQIAPPDELLPEGLGPLPAIEGLIRDQDGAVLLLDLAQLFRELPGGALAVQPLVPLPDGAAPTAEEAPDGQAPAQEALAEETLAQEAPA